MKWKAVLMCGSLAVSLMLLNGCSREQVEGATPQAPVGTQGVVAGGMVSIDRSFAATPLGYQLMEFPLLIADEPGFNGRTYWANQFQFKNGDGGYLGLQANSKDEKRINFSIWGATAWEAGVGTNCKSFTHEGSGVQCWANYAWKEGEKYNLKVQSVGAGRWQASIVEQRTGSRFVVATITVPNNWGGLGESPSSFVEDFAQGNEARASCAEVPATTAVFFRPIANGNVQPIRSSSRTYGPCQAVARSSCTAEQNCLASANTYGVAQAQLKSAAKGYCLDLLWGGNRAGVWGCQANANQLVRLTEDFKLKVRNGTACLNANVQGDVHAVPCSEASRQRWVPIVGSGQFYNVGANACLDTLNHGEEGAYVRAYQCSSAVFQKWSIQR